MNFVRENQFKILGWCLFVKILCFGVGVTDCLGALVVLSFFQVDRIISYKYPIRPDLFKELSLVQEQVQIAISKSETLERDVTGIKIAAGMKGKV